MRYLLSLALLLPAALPDTQVAQQNYLRDHHCKFVQHWTLAEFKKYMPAPSVINGKVVDFTGNIKKPYSEYDCHGMRAYVDDVNGKPWRP